MRRRRPGVMSAEQRPCRLAILGRGWGALPDGVPVPGGRPPGSGDGGPGGRARGWWAGWGACNVVACGRSVPSTPNVVDRLFAGWLPWMGEPRTDR